MINEGKIVSEGKEGSAMGEEFPPDVQFLATFNASLQFHFPSHHSFTLAHLIIQYFMQTHVYILT